MSNPLMHFEKWLSELCDVTRLTYRFDRKQWNRITQEYLDVHALVLLVENGTGIYTLKSIEGMGGAIHISIIAIRPDCQGSGLGKRLISRMINFANGRGYSLSAIAQQMKLSGRGFTPESYAEMESKGLTFATPINDLKKDYTWKRYLCDHYGFVPCGHNNEIVRYPK